MLVPFRYICNFGRKGCCLLKHFNDKYMRFLSFLFILVFQCHFNFAQIPAFPGAEGFISLTTTGGRGGNIYYVSNLNCSGTGSLNDALTKPGPKYILFSVSGIIDCAAEIK